MPSTSYVPLEKYELHSYPPELHTSSPFPNSLSHTTLPHAKLRKSFDSELQNTPYPFASGIPLKTASEKRPTRNNSALELLKALFLPMVAIVAWDFEYITSEYWPVFVASIKAGVTSISILIVSAGLWPLKSLIQDLKSEEFFRVVSSHRSGVPLSVVNGISNPSFGTFDGIKAVIGGHCTPFLSAAILAGLFTIATSTLAPAALTVQTVLTDGPIQAFAVGAVGPQSVYNTTGILSLSNNTVFDNAAKAASIAWAETSLGVTYRFGPKSDSKNKTYIIPTPSELSTSASARWLSDVVTINPVCSWAKTNISQPVDVNSSMSSTGGRIGVFLPDSGIVLKVDTGFSSSVINYAMSTDEIDTATLTAMSNHTSGAPPTDGSSVWVLSQCIGTSCRKPGGPSIYSDLSDLPYIEAITSSGTLQLAFLLCYPRPTIKTHEIRSDGQGTLTVLDNSERTLRKQGNLNPPQTGLLLNAVLNQYQMDSGPQFTTLNTGTLGQLELIFGVEQISQVNLTDGGSDSPSNTIKPLPTSNITETYTTIVQAAAKVYMTGVLGTAYVPGRVGTPTLVFGSSLPHVIASTFLFATLSLVVVIAHFRSDRENKFTLVGIAAALHGSEIPKKISKIKSEQSVEREKELLKALDGKLISLSRNKDGSFVLHIN